MKQLAAQPEAQRSATPRVTVAMPVYNGGKYLRGALDSLRAQDFDEFALIISDNASTDQTQEICLEYASQDDRIRYIRQPTHLTASANFAALLREARTPYFMWAAHDDLWEPAFLRTLVAELDSDDDAVVACCDYDIYFHGMGAFAEHHSPEGLPKFTLSQRRAVVLRELLRFPHPAFVYGLYRTEALQRTRVVRDMQFDWSDLALINELALLGRFALVEEILFHTGIAGTWREPYSLTKRRFGIFRLSYGAYFRSTLTAIARADSVTFRERVMLSLALTHQVLSFIRLHEWQTRRISHRRVPELSYQPTSFAIGEDGVGALVSGWGESESWGTWTVEDEATLHVSVPAGQTTGGFRLRLDYWIIPLPDRQPRVVDCLVGETLLARWSLDDANQEGEMYISIPPDARPRESVDLTFRIHDVRSPFELGISRDTRRIGLGVKRIRLVDKREEDRGG